MLEEQLNDRWVLEGYSGFVLQTIDSFCSSMTPADLCKISPVSYRIAGFVNGHILPYLRRHPVY
jgi:hypothetical protein